VAFLEIDVVEQFGAESRGGGRKFRPCARMLQAGRSVTMSFKKIMLFSLLSKKIMVFTSEELCFPGGEENRQRVDALAVSAHHVVVRHSVQGAAQSRGATPQMLAHVHLQEKLENLNRS
jgi:hypothetical protein